MKSIPLWLILCSTLTGCGFKFHQTTLPARFSPLYVDYGAVAKDWPFRLKQQLTTPTFHLTSDPTHSLYHLSLDHESTQQHILSIGSGGSPRQYEVVYELHYTFERKNNNDNKIESKIVIHRLSTMNNDRILGSQDEQERTLDQMKQDATTQMIEQIQAQIQEGHFIKE